MYTHEHAWQVAGNNGMARSSAAPPNNSSIPMHGFAQNTSSMPVAPGGMSQGVPGLQPRAPDDLQNLKQELWYTRPCKYGASCRFSNCRSCIINHVCMCVCVVLCMRISAVCVRETSYIVSDETRACVTAWFEPLSYVCAFAHRVQRGGRICVQDGLLHVSNALCMRRASICVL
jgi:hypothetical protein